MKPHRIKMAHNLIVNYGLDKKMEVLVCHGFSGIAGKLLGAELVFHFHL